MNDSIQKKRILIVEDDNLVRQSFQLLIESNPSYQIIKGFRTSEEAQGFLNSENISTIDLVILDLGLPGQSGLDMAKRLLELDSQANILILTAQCADHDAQILIGEGVKGILLKECYQEELFFALERVSEGESYLDSRISNRLSHGTGSGNMDIEGYKLSSRQLQILREIVKGKTSQEIAEELDITIKTVFTHRERLRRKLNITSKSDYFKYARILNLKP